MIAFDNSYARLPARFFAKVAPARVRAPALIEVNRALAEELGVPADELDAETLSGNRVPEGADPIALAYAGHQFGNFVPQLGDGRAILLGEVVGKDGRRRDVQLKGAGRTPFSRGGDGRAALGPVLREYVVSEAMHALGVPTTRALAAVTTGEPVAREELLQGAVLTRVAASHLRVGTFEYFAAREDGEAIAALVSYALARHYPAALAAAGDAPPALVLLQQVIDAQAHLVARWLGVGFIHGVMNTDNTSISGETIDYGPCAFLDIYHPRRKFSSIDRGGRYHFAVQPKIMQWNLARLAETLLPLLAESEEEQVHLATGELNRFADAFDAAYARVLRAKLGLHTEEDGDRALANDLFERMATNEVDFTLFFRRLGEDADAAAKLFANPGAFHDWAEAWRRRTAKEDVSPSARAESMRRANPAFIPRNHRIEEMIAAANNGNYAPFERLNAVLARPHDDQPENADLAEPPGPEQHDYRTFCGT
ncbi:MAG: YdiU family protein [Labilithrix sp.]|nr:YdiU family protein [Labilithrix sp.]MCW5813149.1 YdiU family protein [Labilithrix sp.]